MPVRVCVCRRSVRGGTTSLPAGIAAGGRRLECDRPARFQDHLPMLGYGGWIAGCGQWTIQDGLMFHRPGSPKRNLAALSHKLNPAPGSARSMRVIDRSRKGGCRDVATLRGKGRVGNRSRW